MAGTTASTMAPRGRDAPAERIVTDEITLTRLRVVAGVAALAAATLMVDVFLPANVWAAFLHLSLVFLGVWLARPRDVLGLAGLASGLVVLGHALTAPGLSLGVASSGGVANRTIVLLAIWALAAVLVAAKRREVALHARLGEEAARRREMEAALASARRGLSEAADLADRVVEIHDLGHEVRTLLNAIIGFSELAQREVFGPQSDPRYQDYMTHINESGRHLLAVFERHMTAMAKDSEEPEPGARRPQAGSVSPEQDAPRRHRNSH